MDRCRRALRYLAAAFLLLWACAWMLKDRYPPLEWLTPALQLDPNQTPATTPPFRVDQGGVTYTITPKADYVLYGLVVSAHDTDAWWDFYHAAWGDYLNVKDLCVIWGPNLRPEVLENVTFTNTSFTCWARWSRPVPFSGAHLSNNHLLTDNPDLQQRLRRIDAGDQIRLAGQLVEYSSGPTFSRGTSLTRTDTGMGACETIYITDLEILREATPFWRDLYGLSRLGALGSLTLLAGLWVHGLFRSDPLQDPVALHARGAALALRGRHRQACRLFDEALHLDPTLHQAYADRAICLEALGDYERAAQDRTLAARHAPPDQPPEPR